MFKPKYVKNGEMLLKGVNRFINYRRDILPAEKVDEILGLKAELGAALKNREPNLVEKHSKRLTSLCEGLGGDYRESALAENIEVIFVAVAIALGIRAYIAQPFKIPTGSMQPTLNGIIAYPTEGDLPNTVVRVFDWTKRGRTWVNGVAKQDETLVDFREYTRFKFFTYTDIRCQSGNVYTVPAPRNQVIFRSGADGSFDLRPGQRFAKGESIVRGYVDTGDQVIVDKYSYHFVPPKRGEVFVFTTKDIRNIQVDPPEMGSIHYIKRLAGLPGDVLVIQEPNLFVNGEVAEEFGFQRVMSLEDGYRGYQNSRDTDYFDVPPHKYVALGDNSFNSFDSRGWGYVPEANLVGRAMMVYWPMNGHWGRVR